MKGFLTYHVNQAWPILQRGAFSICSPGVNRVESVESEQHPVPHFPAPGPAPSCCSGQASTVPRESRFNSLPCYFHSNTGLGDFQVRIHSPAPKSNHFKLSHNPKAQNQKHPQVKEGDIRAELKVLSTIIARDAPTEIFGDDIDGQFLRRRTG